MSTTMSENNIKSVDVGQLIVKDRNNVHNLTKSGRPRKTSRRDDKMIIREIKKDYSISAQATKENLSLINIHGRTMRRRLNKCGFKNYLAKKKPFISPKNKKERLLFAKQYINKPLSFWQSVI
ncbi:uncharacterized protein LOC143150664 [Ptiloglossa arizonensis]|uniref:uncharacterized protein LOC143150664 n=1 Tax=Ptiloglossa arizonensis TaxID=3350558 RepID=UPI003F9F2A5F